MLLKALLLTIGLTIPTMQPVYAQPSFHEKAVVSLSSEGKYFCTGVAIDSADKTLVLTATHCIAAAAMRNITIEWDGKACDVPLNMVHDGNDHTIVATCHKWSHRVSFSQKRKLRPGTKVVQYGHPNGLPLMYREGYYMGQAPSPFLWAMQDDTGWFYDLMGWKGDSGGPIFHKGWLVGTVSAGYSPKDEDNRGFAATVSYPYTFTKQQLKDIGL